MSAIIFLGLGINYLASRAARVDSGPSITRHFAWAVATYGKRVQRTISWVAEVLGFAKLFDEQVDEDGEVDGDSDDSRSDSDGASDSDTDGETTLVNDSDWAEFDDEKDGAHLPRSVSFDISVFRTKAPFADDADLELVIEEPAEPLEFPTLNVGCKLFVGRALSVDAPAFVPRGRPQPALRVDAPVFVPKACTPSALRVGAPAVALEGARTAALRADAPAFVPRAG